MSQKQKIIQTMLREREGMLIDKEPARRIYELDKEISNAIIENESSLDADFIIETLKTIGKSVCLLTNDTGLWAITDRNTCITISKGRAEYVVTSHSFKDQWKKTIRGAIKQYLINQSTK